MIKLECISKSKDDGLSTNRILSVELPSDQERAIYKLVRETIRSLCRESKTNFKTEIRAIRIKGYKPKKS